MKHIRSAMSTSFLIALLGFFESSVAAKSLGGSSIPGIELSANREMIALGTANLVGSCFMALPAFGGYGRSKVNKTTGAKTPMSSVFLSLFSLLSVLFLLPYFYFLPVRNYLLSKKALSETNQVYVTETRPFSNDFSRGMVADRRGAPRYLILPTYSRLDRVGSHGSHLLLHHLLFPNFGYGSWSRNLFASRH